MGIYLGMVANSIIIFFWLPMFVYLPPGRGYRHMLGAPCSMLAALGTLIYAIVLTVLSVFNRRYVILKILAVALNLLPTVLLIGMIMLLALRDNYPKP